MGVIHATSVLFPGERPDYITGGQFVQDHDGVSWQVIADTVLDVSAADITFTGIPATYRSLMLEIMARSDAAVEADNMLVQFNSDTGANYDYQYLLGVATIAVAGESLAASFIFGGYTTGASGPADVASVTRIWVSDYAGTWQKQLVAQIGHKRGTATTKIVVGTSVGYWRNTAVIDTIKLYPGSGSFIAGTVATLWGML